MAALRVPPLPAVRPHACPSLAVSAGLGPAWRPHHHRLACIDPPPPPQSLLDSAPPGAPTIIDWHAGWAAACRADRAGLEALAARNPRMVFVRVDVEAGGANGALAREKVRGAHCSRPGASVPVRKSARPGEAVGSDASLCPPEVECSGKHGVHASPGRWGRSWQRGGDTQRGTWGAVVHVRQSAVGKIPPLTTPPPF